MALNLKNHEVEQLAAELAQLTGESKTEVIRRALLERKEKLAYRIARNDNKQSLLKMLEQEIWALAPSEQLGKRLSRKEEEVILGYGENGI
ncbi:MAG: type II toxin-antitoxin system VapB family antitoxin [Deltaproteobacteria bacterium]|nr:type II toxin-antitoxin system VapB family antitoxin [Deltaproteobacteria bacterium]